MPAAMTRASAALTASGSTTFLPSASVLRLAEEALRDVVPMVLRLAEEPNVELSDMADMERPMARELADELRDMDLAFLGTSTISALKSPGRILYTAPASPGTSALPSASSLACSAITASCPSALNTASTFCASRLKRPPSSFLLIFRLSSNTSSSSAASSASSASSSSSLGPSATTMPSSPASPICSTRSGCSVGVVARPRHFAANRLAWFTMSCLLHRSALRCPTMAMSQAR
mmetsp:Transcript_28573/g.70425  ORF Transcript_28573/g.70425 Transcript_28573/m.70425 type:complete len:234 (-) Transcript_28573:896-1597(-)